jgi:hypothetical protein
MMVGKSAGKISWFNGYVFFRCQFLVAGLKYWIMMGTPRGKKPGKGTDPKWKHHFVERIGCFF